VQVSFQQIKSLPGLRGSLKAGFQHNATHATQPTQAPKSDNASYFARKQRKRRTNKNLRVWNFHMIKITLVCCFYYCHINSYNNIKKYYLTKSIAIGLLCNTFLQSRISLFLLSVIFTLSSADAETVQNVSHWMQYYEARLDGLQTVAAPGCNWNWGKSL